MQEVSARAVAVFADIAREVGVPVPELYQGLPVAESFSQRPRGRIDWATYCCVAERVVAICGDGTRLEEAVCQSVVRGVSFAYVRRVLGLCVDVRQVYRIIDRWFGPSLFPHIISSQRELPDGRLEQRLEIPRPYRSCEAFLRINTAALRATPLYLGQPAAVLEAELSPRLAIIRISPPPSATLVSKARRLWRVVSGTRGAMDELGAQQVELRERFEELRDAHGQITDHAERLRTINAIGRELAERVDLDELGQTVVGQLRDRIGVSSVALWIRDEPGATPRELAASGSSAGLGAQEHELLIAGRRVGKLQVWIPPGADAVATAQLVGELVPWIAIASDNALSFRQVKRSQALLEQRVQERTVELQQTAAELEEALLERERLDAERARFFANASHELRTPLTLVVPVLEELASSPKLSVEGRQAATDAWRSGLRMTRLVNDLLDSSKLEAQRMQLRPQPVDLAAMTRTVLRYWQAELEARGVTVQRNLPKRLVVDLDPERIEAVLWNLLANGVRHVPNGGRLAVQAGVAGETVHWTITNDGSAIPAEELPRLFERFAQASDSSLRRYGTSGLGLAVVAEMVQLHGGVVGAENLPQGRGVRFRVQLPLSRPVSSEEPVVRSAASAELVRLFAAELRRGAPDESAAEPAGASMVRSGPDRPQPRLLIVEDDGPLRAYLRRVLRDDYEVLEAADGRQGLVRAREAQPDLILSDLMMPELDGIELVRQLDADEATQMIPVVMLTARSDLDAKLTGLASGADDYVVKPFRIEELRARLAVQLRLRELSLRLAERERLAILGTLVAGVAHEVRHALNGVLNTVGPLAERFVAGPPDVVDLLEVATLSAQRMEELTRQLLAMSRAGASPHLEVDLVQTIRLALKLRGQPAGQLRIELDLPSGDEPPVLVMGDAGALMQVWLNLLDNASRAASPQGRVKVQLTADGEDVLVAVSDDGPGVPRAIAERIFEPFFTTRPGGEGTGLGLAMVRSTVLKHGGRVQLARATGGGACFRVSLPRRPTRTESTPPHSPR